MRRSDMTFQNVVDFLPEGKKGVAEIRHMEIGEDLAKFSMIREIVTGGRERSVKPGRYVQLLVGRRLMMSDTQMERETNSEFVERAHGDVFIAGLGIGMVLPPLLKKPNVDSIFVAEKYQDVIDLVAPAFKGAIKSKRLVIRRTDVFKMRLPKTRFSTIYFDIWPNIHADNLKEMASLCDRFKPCLKRGGWMDSWMRKELKQRSHW